MSSVPRSSLVLTVLASSTFASPSLLRISALFPGVSLSWPSLFSLSLSRRCPCYSINIAPKDIAVTRGVSAVTVFSFTFFIVDYNLEFRHTTFADPGQSVSCAAAGRTQKRLYGRVTQSRRPSPGPCVLKSVSECPSSSLARRKRMAMGGGATLRLLKRHSCKKACAC